MDKWDYLKNHPQNIFLFSLLICFLNMKPLSEVSAGILVIQIQIQAVWTVALLAVIPSLTAVHQMVDFLPR